MQVRDILNVNDLIDAYSKALKNVNAINGQIFNIGGGTKNILSLLELIEYLNILEDREIEYSFSDWWLGESKSFCK